MVAVDYPVSKALTHEPEDFHFTSIDGLSTLAKTFSCNSKVDAIL